MFRVQTRFLIVLQGFSGNISVPYKYQSRKIFDSFGGSRHSGHTFFLAKFYRQPKPKYVRDELPEKSDENAQGSGKELTEEISQN
jgi:hypothetical protein